jgi:nucleoside-diphosphate-sugar epimerase
MRILLTGAGGFLGPQIVRRLLERPVVEIRCLVRTNSAALEPLAAADSRVRIVSGNLLNPADLDEALENIDTVIHAAAGMKGSPADMYLNTVVTSARLIEAIERAGSVRKVTLISSFSVYGAACRPRGALLDEQFCIEPEPQRRDAYTFAKTRQDLLFREFHKRSGIPLVIVRPGVIYGPGGSPLSTRVALDLGPIMLHMGRGNRLPLTYVANCAEAIAVATCRDVVFDVVNVVDDGIPTCRQYFRQYRRHVAKVRFVTLPYFGIRILSRTIAWYHRYSDGQLPAFLTPYIAKALWGGNRFSNAHLKEIGWRQLVSTEEGLSRSFAALRQKAS